MNKLFKTVFCTFAYQAEPRKGQQGHSLWIACIQMYSQLQLSACLNVLTNQTNSCQQANETNSIKDFCAAYLCTKQAKSCYHFAILVVAVD